MAFVFFGGLAGRLIRTAQIVVRVLDRSAENLAKGRALGWLDEIPNRWVRNALLNVVPGKLGTSWRLPIAFLFDTTLYAVADPFTGFHPEVLDYYNELTLEQVKKLHIVYVENESTLQDQLKLILSQHVIDNGDGSQTVMIPRLWFRDP